MSQKKNTTLTQEQKAALLPLKDITDLVNVPKLKLSQKILSQISYYHNLVGDVEWSGPLIYSIPKLNNITDLYKEAKKQIELVIDVEEILLADIGTSGFTSYDFNNMDLMGDIMDYQMAGKQIGHCHTHHSMSTFFSGTDNEELQENTINHKFYLSLIVNYASGGKYSARLCSKANESTPLSELLGKFSIKTLKKGASLSDFLLEKEVIYYIDLDIEYDMDQKTIDRHTKLIEAKKVVPTPPVKTNYYGDYGDFGIGHSWQRKFPSSFSSIKEDVEEEESVVSLDRGHIIDFLYRIVSVDYEIDSKDITLRLCQDLFRNVQYQYSKVELDYVSSNLENTYEHVIEMIWGVNTFDEDEILLILNEAGKILKDEFGYYAKINDLYNVFLEDYITFMIENDDDEDDFPSVNKKQLKLKLYD